MLEREIQHAIRIALGGERDLDLERRTVGQLKNGNGVVIRFGTPGEADLQGVLRMTVWLDPAAQPIEMGRFFALEIKQPQQHSTAVQKMWAERKRMRGGFVAEVHSVAEARAALERARRGERQ